MHIRATEEYHPNQIKIIIDKIVDSMTSGIFDAKINVAYIYFSLEEILQYFVDEDYHVHIVKSLMSWVDYRSTQELMEVENTDDTLYWLLNHLESEWVIKEWFYVGTDEVLTMEEKDKEQDNYDKLKIDSWTETRPWTLLYSNQNWIFCTKENILFSVGWWWIRIPDDFLVILLKRKLKKSKEAYIVWEKCAIDIDNMEIVWEKRGKKLKFHKWKSSNRFYLNNLIDYKFSEDKNLREIAERNLALITDDEVHELRKLFSAVTAEQIISYKKNKLDFEYSHCKRL